MAINVAARTAYSNSPLERGSNAAVNNCGNVPAKDSDIVPENKCGQLNGCRVSVYEDSANQLKTHKEVLPKRSTLAQRGITVQKVEESFGSKGIKEFARTSLSSVLKEYVNNSIELNQATINKLTKASFHPGEVLNKQKFESKVRGFCAAGQKKQLHDYVNKLIAAAKNRWTERQGEFKNSCDLAKERVYLELNEKFARKNKLFEDISKFITSAIFTLRNIVKRLATNDGVAFILPIEDFPFEDDSDTAYKLFNAKMVIEKIQLDAHGNLVIKIPEFYGNISVASQGQSEACSFKIDCTLTLKQPLGKAFHQLLTSSLFPPTNLKNAANELAETVKKLLGGDKSANKSANKSVNKSANKPANKPANKLDQKLFSAFDLTIHSISERPDIRNPNQGSAREAVKQFLPVFSRVFSNLVQGMRGVTEIEAEYNKNIQQLNHSVLDELQYMKRVLQAEKSKSSIASSIDQVIAATETVLQSILNSDAVKKAQTEQKVVDVNVLSKGAMESFVYNSLYNFFSFLFQLRAKKDTDETTASINLSQKPLTIPVGDKDAIKIHKIQAVVSPTPKQQDGKLYIDCEALRFSLDLIKDGKTILNQRFQLPAGTIEIGKPHAHFFKEFFRADLPYSWHDIKGLADQFFNDKSVLDKKNNNWDNSDVYKFRFSDFNYRKPDPQCSVESFVPDSSKHWEENLKAMFMQGFGESEEYCQSLVDNLKLFFEIDQSNSNYALESGLKVPQVGVQSSVISEDDSLSWCGNLEAESDPLGQVDPKVKPIASEMTVRPGDIVEALYSSKLVRRLLRLLLGSQPLTLQVKEIGRPCEFELETTEFSVLSLLQSLRLYLLRILVTRAVKSEQINLIIGADGRIATGRSVGV